MSEPFLAEIRMFSFDFPPRGWALCDGQLLPINQNQALFSLLGTNYGGDGRTTFALPNLRGRTPIHASATHPLGQSGGAETHILHLNEMPQHSHALRAVAADATERGPGGNLPALAEEDTYATSGPLTALLQAVMNTGGGQAHDNMQPFLVLSFCIALQGIYPSRN